MSPRSTAFVTHLLHGGDLVARNVPKVTGAVARQGIPDINEQASLVRIQADDDRVARSARRARQLEALRNVRIRVSLAVQQFRFYTGQESLGVGAAPAHRMPASIGRRHQARFFRPALAVLADIKCDELALRERLDFRLVPGIELTRTAPAGTVPATDFGNHLVCFLPFMQAVGINSEHQSVVVAGQDRPDVRRGTKDLGHALRFDPAREIHDIAEMNEWFIRMAVKCPLHQATPEQRLLRRALCHFDIGVYGAVIVVQGKARR